MKIKLAAIDSNPRNPRTEFKLIESMNAHGQRKAIDVVKRGKRYLIVDGERRFRTAISLKWDYIEADVKDMTDAEIDIAVLDFAQAEPLPELDEAAHMARLIAENGWRIEELASRLARNETDVRKRLKMHALHDDMKALIRQGAVAATDALVLHRVSADDQAKTAKMIHESTWVADGVQVPRKFLLTHVERYMLSLTDPGFDTKETSMPGGACSVCPKRTGNQTVLAGFEDMVSQDRCTDPICFRSKLDAVWERACAAEPDAARLEGQEARRAIAGQGYQMCLDGPADALARDGEGRTVRLSKVMPAAPRPAQKPAATAPAASRGMSAKEREETLTGLAEDPEPGMVAAGLRASGAVRGEWLAEIASERGDLEACEDWGVIVEIVGAISDDAIRAMVKWREGR